METLTPSDYAFLGLFRKCAYLCQWVFELLSQNWDGRHEMGVCVFYTYYRRDLLIFFSTACNVHQVLSMLADDNNFVCV